MTLWMTCHPPPRNNFNTYNNGNDFQIEDGVGRVRIRNF